MAKKKTVKTVKTPLKRGGLWSLPQRMKVEKK